MPLQLDENLTLIGVLSPDRFSHARKVHAIVKATRPYSWTAHFAPCGNARWYSGVDNLVRDGRIDTTGDVLDVTCKLCKKYLDKYLGKFDLSNPDWEV